MTDNYYPPFRVWLLNHVLKYAMPALKWITGGVLLLTPLALEMWLLPGSPWSIAPFIVTLVGTIGLVFAYWIYVEDRNAARRRGR